MGYLAHRAIVVTAWDSKYLELAHEKAKQLELEVSEIVEGRMNGQVSFLIAVDGSKEGWNDSDEADAQRAEWIKWVREQEGLYVDWALIRFGGDDPQWAKLEDHNG